MKSINRQIDEIDRIISQQLELGFFKNRFYADDAANQFHILIYLTLREDL